MTQAATTSSALDAPQPAPAVKSAGYLTAKSPDFADPAPTGVPGQTNVKAESNPFNDPDPRMLVYAWVGFLLRILLVFGAVFSILQYVAQREEKRVERTMGLIDMWDRPEFQEAQRALKDRLVALTEANKGLLGSNPSETERKVFQASIGQQLMTERGGAMPLDEFTVHFERIVYFLNRLATCVKSNICDRDVADDYFMDYAQSFWTYFADYIADARRSGSPNFAKPIEEYVASAEPAPAAQ